MLEKTKMNTEWKTSRCYSIFVQNIIIPFIQKQRDLHYSAERWVIVFEEGPEKYLFSNKDEENKKPDTMMRQTNKS